MPTPSMRAWYIVADASRARVFEQAAPGGDLTERTELELTDADAHRHSSELGDSRPGQGTSGAGGRPHRMEPRAEPRDHEMDLFADRVARAIDAGDAERAFDRLVLVSSPRFLGRLRKRLGAGAAKKLAGSLDRDLTRMQASEIAAHLAQAKLLRARP